MEGSIVDDISTTTHLQWEGKDPDVLITFGTVGVNYDMIETLGIEMETGRSFSSDLSSDSLEVIFNEAAIDVMGLEDPVGKTIMMWGKDRIIAGVAKNFHFKSLHENVGPFVVRLESTDPDMDRIMVKIEAGRERETVEELRRFYHEYNEGFPFDYKFLDEGYQAQYEAEKRVATLSQYFGGFCYPHILPWPVWFGCLYRRKKTQRNRYPKNIGIECFWYHLSFVR